MRFLGFALLGAVVAFVWRLLKAKHRAGAAAESDRKAPLDYDQMIMLDAEDLAEGGIKEAYERLLPFLRKYTAQPWDVEEHLDNDAGTYAVTAGGREYVIAGPNIDEHDGWGLATAALFNIVNMQLKQADHRLYAINSGNELGGMFLTATEATAAQRALPRKPDWPYLPADEPPWFGQFH